MLRNLLTLGLILAASFATGQNRSSIKFGVMALPAFFAYVSIGYEQYLPGKSSIQLNADCLLYESDEGRGNSFSIAPEYRNYFRTGKPKCDALYYLAQLRYGTRNITGYETGYYFHRLSMVHGLGVKTNPDRRLFLDLNLGAGLVVQVEKKESSYQSKPILFKVLPYPSLKLGINLGETIGASESANSHGR